MPPYLLNRAAPAPDSNQIITALTAALHGWERSKEPEQSVQVLVGPPGSGVEQATVALAKKMGGRSWARLQFGKFWLAEMPG